MPVIKAPAISAGTVNAGSTPASSRGITVTNPGAANTKGAWVTVIASTAVDAKALLIQVSHDNSAVVDERALVDIGVGAAASEVVLVPNLIGGGIGYTTVKHCHSYILPVRVAAGTRIAARFQSNRASSWGAIHVHVTLLAYAGGRDYGAVDSIGLSTAASIGTDVDPGASANTKGTWTSLGTTTKPIRKLSLASCTQNADNTSGNWQTWMCDVATANDNSGIVLPDLQLVRHFATAMLTPVLGPFDVEIPSGTTLYARLASNENNSGRRKLWLAAYGM